MKNNTELGYTEIARHDNYTVGRKGSQYRAYGYEWYGNHDASLEGEHHEVCGRGATAEEAIRMMVAAAIRAGEAGGQSARGGRDHWVSHPGLTRAEALAMQDQLLEAIAELVGCEASERKNNSGFFA